MKKAFFIICLIMVGNLCYAQQNNNPVYKKAEKLFNEKKYDEALKIYNQLLDKDSSDADLWSWKGVVLSALKKYEDASRCFNKAVYLAPNDPKEYLHRGCFYLSLNYQDEAIEDFNEGIKHADDNDSTKYQLLYARARSRFYQHDYETSLKDLRVDLDHDSVNPVYLAQIVFTFIQMKNYDSGMKYLWIWKRNHPEDMYADIDLAFIYESMGEFKKAIAINTTLIESKKYDNISNVFDNRGYEKFKLNDFEGALKDINKSLVIDSTNSYAYKNRALVYMGMYQQKNACKDLEKALKMGYTLLYGNEAQELLDKNCKP
jgi:tetratricopeptide (TPR) repeat protein